MCRSCTSPYFCPTCMQHPGPQPCSPPRMKIGLPELFKHWQSLIYLPLFLQSSCFVYTASPGDKSLSYGTEKSLYRDKGILQNVSFFVTLSGQIQCKSSPGSSMRIWRRPVHAPPRHEPVGYFIFSIINILNVSATVAVEEFWTEAASEHLA